ncbi:TetR/AcrR family transcriptional regulator [Gordonia polyisoprenivorans]|uniref:TetR/AcrR family transcriptional regulator n=1 Tax=Gordonia polyisoprenivorans TaxID=84595 RepID=UPI000B99F195|nr:TetR family transcriptional regulator [Gordonia polyisoprenivorans]OZC31944.1 TetR family transcriptional regulator [Gordonia polyisoprenivorans]UZF55315.1 TetR family transcriptional regulator [Gordonia polyisoprenivorans]
MEKATRIRLLDAGLALLGTIGAGSTSTRAVEVEAKASHGSIRHHFGGRKGFYAALADHLYDSDRPRPGESMAQLVQRLVGPDRAVTLARYELTLLATCDSDLQSSMIAGRDRFVDELVARGVDRADARLVIAALDGFILDLLLRGVGPDDPTSDPSALVERLTVRDCVAQR